MLVRLLLSLSLGLLLAGSLPAAAASEFSRQLGDARQALEQLQQLLEESPEQLVVSLPRMPLSPLRNFDHRCFMSALLGLGEQLRAISLCAVASHSGVMLWERQDGRWHKGVLLVLQRSRWGSGSVPADNWQDLAIGAPWTRAVSRSTRHEVRLLQALWDTLDERLTASLAPALWDAPELWPAGVRALHRDGRLMLGGNSLAGLAAWQHWMQQQSWSDGVLGVAAVKDSHDGYSASRPGLLLETLSLGGVTYGAVLYEGEPISAGFTLWATPGRQLILEPLTDSTAYR